MVASNIQHGDVIQVGPAVMQYVEIRDARGGAVSALDRFLGHVTGDQRRVQPVALQQVLVGSALGYVTPVSTTI